MSAESSKRQVHIQNRLTKTAQHRVQRIWLTPSS